MPETNLNLNLSPIAPIAQIVETVGDVIIAILQHVAQNRATMTVENRDRYDRVALAGLERWDRWCERIDKFLTNAT